MRASEQGKFVTAPRVPDPAPARRFPVVATVAPVLASLVLFAITRSPFTLMFALMGPVIAIATTADAALQRRRSGRWDAASLDREFLAAEAEIEKAHAVERAEREVEFPRASEAIGRAVHDDSVVRVGTGGTASSVELRGFDRSAPSERLDALRKRAATVENSAVTADAASGISIVGGAAAALACARSIVVQLAARLDPIAGRIEAPDAPEWDWLAGLPHEVQRGGASGRVLLVDAAKTVSVDLAAHPTRLAGVAGTTLRIEAGGLASMGSDAHGFEPELLSEESARDAAARVRATAASGDQPSGLPEQVELARLDQSGSNSGLIATIGMDSRSPVAVDLVSDGPHAIVGGTTGSGKSELLVSWVLAMAAERSPTEVTFLFVDFKGGAAFEPLTGLPHCVGLITDLDPEGSLRALASLGAELRYRERVLAEHSLRSLDDAGDAPPFPRLVMVVDEYAALVDTHSLLHSVFTDIAARGRSLGVHLILCTQRPAGVVRDSILANCPLRISLRVLTAADSNAVIGTDAAATLPARPVGRALLARAGERPRALQVARSTTSDAHAVAERWAASPRPRIPWLPPLAASIPLSVVPGRSVDESLAFGVADLPELQAQEPARYSPETDGSLLVVGAARSGKSGVLAALESAPSTSAVERLPRELPELWDALQAVRDDAGSSSRLLLLDDVDAIVASCDEAYRSMLLDLLAELLRDAPGIRLALTVQRISGVLQPLVGLCGSLLILRMPNRQEHVLAGGSAAEFRESLPAGGGYWHGHRTQVFATDPRTPLRRELRSAPLDLASAPITVVSTRPGQFADRLRALAPGRSINVLGSTRFDATSEQLSISRGGAPAILVADPDTWQAQWSLLATLQRESDLLFDGCSLAELRAITRSRELPPPFARGQRALWLRSREGELARVSLDDQPGLGG